MSRRRPNTKPDPMTHDEWVQAALDAAVEQFGTIEITDPATLNFLADVLSHPGNRDR